MDDDREIIVEKSNNENANGALKALGVVLTIVAFITGVASIVRPLQQQNSYLQTQINLVEAKTEKQVEYLRDRLDNMIEREIDRLRKENNKLRDKFNKAR